MTKVVKIFFCVFVVVALCGLLSKKVWAADQLIVCDNNGCTTPISPLFNETNLAPGVQIIKTLAVTNNRSEQLSLILTNTKSSETDDMLLTWINLKITDEAANTKYDNSLENFLNGASVDLGTLGQSSTQTYTFTAQLADLDNTYQNKQAVFNLYLHVTGQVDNGGQNNNSSGNNSSSNTSSSNFNSSSQTGSVLGTTNVRRLIRRFTGSIDLTPEPVISATPSPVAVEVVSPQVLGDQTEACKDQNYPWWWPLIAEAVIMILWLTASGRRSKRVVFAGILTIAIFTQIVHQILGCNCATSVWCKYFWMFNLVEVLIGAAFVWKRSKKH